MNLDPFEVREQVRTIPYFPSEPWMWDLAYAVYLEMADDSTGHDWWHVLRVTANSLSIAQDEGCLSSETAALALLHDVEDWKFSGNLSAGKRKAAELMSSCGVPESVGEMVGSVLCRLSFLSAAEMDRPLSRSAECVRDADRLDAVGAIGLSRVFAFGGFSGRPIISPCVPLRLEMSRDEYMNHEGTSWNHIFEKLILLKDRMSTARGREMAEVRHGRLLRFIDDVRAEWDEALCMLPLP